MAGSVYEGKTYDEAVRKGLEALRLSRAEAVITTIEEGKGGFLGFGARPFRVSVMRRPGGAIREPGERPRESKTTGDDRRGGRRGAAGPRGREERPERGGRGGREAHAQGRGERARGRDRGPSERAASEEKSPKSGPPARSGRGERGGRGGRDARAAGERPVAEEREVPREAPREREARRDERGAPAPTAHAQPYPPRSAEGPPREERERPERRPSRPAAAAPPAASAEDEGSDAQRKRRRRGRRGGRGRRRGGSLAPEGALGVNGVEGAVAPGPEERNAPPSPAAEAWEDDADELEMAPPAATRAQDFPPPPAVEPRALTGRPESDPASGREEAAESLEYVRAAEADAPRGTMEAAAAGAQRAWAREPATSWSGERHSQPRERGERAERPESPDMSADELSVTSKRLAEELLKAMGFEPRVSVRTEGNRVDVTVEVDRDEELLNGRQGETRQALQHLLNRFLNRGDGSRYHLQLEINDFWQRREDELAELARKLADDAVTRNAEMVSDYLNSQERRIMHMTLREDARVKTFSLGSGMVKRVAVAPAGFPDRTGEEPES